MAAHHPYHSSAGEDRGEQGLHGIADGVVVQACRQGGVQFAAGNGAGRPRIDLCVQRCFVRPGVQPVIELGGCVDLAAVRVERYAGQRGEDQRTVAMQPVLGAVTEVAPQEHGAGRVHAAQGMRAFREIHGLEVPAVHRSRPSGLPRCTAGSLGNEPVELLQRLDFDDARFFVQCR